MALTSKISGNAAVYHPTPKNKSIDVCNQKSRCYTNIALILLGNGGIVVHQQKISDIEWACGIYSNAKNNSKLSKKVQTCSE